MTEEYSVMLNNEEFIGTTESLTLRTRCRINPLKTKRKLFYLKTQFVPRSKHLMSVIEANQFMLYRAKFSVCSEINTKHIRTVWAECTIF
jgi:hypothetical protein